MKKEDMVCTFEQAKKIVELGVKLNSLFYWWGQNNLYDCGYIFGWVNKWNNGHPNKHQLPAYTVAELGVLLPGEVFDDDDLYVFSLEDITKCPNGQWEYKCDQFFDTEAQARAEALIWLIENKHVKVEDLKL